jgi:hypothetical protein
MSTPLRAAIVYDFDGTLAPRNLPEHTFLLALGIAEPETFWEAVKEEARATHGCEILAYMHRLLAVAKAKGVSVTRELLQEHGRSVPLFAGLDEWFAEIDAYGREQATTPILSTRRAWGRTSISQASLAVEPAGPTPRA